MNNVIYKLKFPYGVHFGKRDVSDSENTFSADTLFSALALEALRIDKKELEHLYQAVNQERLLFSDGFPYVGETLYIPKPFLYIQGERTEEASKMKKIMKKLKYIPVNAVDDFLNQTLDAENENRCLAGLGKKEEKVCVLIEEGKETKPYRVGIYHFEECSGLYVIVRYKTKAELDLFEKFLQMLSFSGLGGERSSGYGRFVYTKIGIPLCLAQRFEQKYKHYMALSVCMAAENELDQAVKGATYQLKKRSGFIDSEFASESGFRKKDFYVFSSGSCFRNPFLGDVFDVSRNSSHPVYRYAKSMLIGVR